MIEIQKESGRQLAVIKGQEREGARTEEDEKGRRDVLSYTPVYGYNTTVVFQCA